MTELLLFLADRAEHVERTIAPALECGEVVLCDRFFDSTIAYQALGLELPLDIIAELNHFAAKGLKPNLTLLLDIDPEIALLRVRHKTAFELIGIDFYRRVRDGYLWLAKREQERIKVIDASQD